MLENVMVPVPRTSRLARHSRLAPLAVLALGALGCVADPVPVSSDYLKGTRYIRYTIRAQPGDIVTGQQTHRSNYLSFPKFREVGSKVDIVSYTDKWVDLSFNGVKCRMYYRDKPFGTTPEEIKKFVDKHFAPTLEELNLDSIDKSKLDGIKSGVPAIQFTKEQVFMSLGYPCHIGNFEPADDLTRDQIFAADQWIYRVNEFMWFTTWYVYTFDKDGIFVQRTS